MGSRWDCESVAPFSVKVVHEPSHDSSETPTVDDAKRYARHELENSVLYSVVQGWLETFLAMASEAYLRPLPRHVVEEFEKYLRCGILAWGFARAYCRSCGASMLVAFSCSFAGCARRAERGARARPQQTWWTESFPTCPCDNGC